MPPADTDIEAAIEAVGPLADIAVAALDSALITRYGDDSTQAYLDAIIAELGHAPASAAWLRFVYTPLHGVAGRLALRAFEQAGFAAPDVVDAQFEPDPDFPTVRFPNPEEPGALDLAIARARRSSADLIIANDPDGDRLAVAIPDPAAPGGYRQLTGDQVGALLGSFLLRRLAADPGTDMARQLVVSTVVSGSLLAKIAAAAGAQYAQTLTGFKWIVRAADLREGVRFAFGYEEALGYAVTSAVRDKDGISAALAVLSLAAVARSAGESLQDAYDALEIEHGVHLTAQLTLPTEATVDVMSRLRASAPARTGRRAGHGRDRLQRRELGASLRRHAQLPAARSTGGDQAERHRAEDQGLPGGRRARRRPDAGRSAFGCGREDGPAARSRQGASRLDGARLAAAS